jgi:hypothetical protein
MSPRSSTPSDTGFLSRVISAATKSSRTWLDRIPPDDKDDLIALKSQVASGEVSQSFRGLAVAIRKDMMSRGIPAPTVDTIRIWLSGN